MRTDLNQTARSLQADIETLNALVHSLLQTNHTNAIRWDHLDDHLLQMGNDLTATIASHLADNADSHDLLADRMARTEAVLNARTHDLSALTRQLAPLVGGITAQRKELHGALAWFPTWSALTPLKIEPLVSVIVPTRNRRSLLETALASLGRQSYTNWEALVVNDGSTDDTGAFLRTISAQDNRIRMIEATGVGPGGARQLGLEHAHGDVIAYLDDDNLMSDGWLRAVVEVLGRRPEVNAVYGAQLREVDTVDPWLLLEPFDQLRLLEGSFIDIGVIAHRPIDGVAHPDDARGLEDWVFLMSLSEMCTPVPLPVIASVYLSGAAGRRTLTAARSEIEEFVRSSAVRPRLDDPEFVERALRSIEDDDRSTGFGGSARNPDHDTEMLIQVVRNISHRSDAPIRILEWGLTHGSESVRSSLSDPDVRWLRMQQRAGHVGDAAYSAVAERSVPQLDASTAATRRVRESVAESPLAEIWIDSDLETHEDVEPPSPPGRYVQLPTELGVEFDVVIIDGPGPRECVRRAREILSSTGLVLLNGPDPRWHDTDVEEFTSWRPIGDEFWVGSTVDTDFTGVVPIRALLRGMRRIRQHEERSDTY